MVPPGIPEFPSRVRHLRPGPATLEGRAWSGWGRVVRVDVSVDGGETWGEVDPTLLDAAAPLALLFHAVPPPLPAPVLELQLGASPAGEVMPTGPTADGPNVFALAGGSVPAQVLDTLGRTTGSGRARTDVLVFSRAVCDVAIESLELFYDPSGG
jgi:hypothetical protein